jgi:hypothetical protein
MRSTRQTDEDKVRARAHEIWEQAGRPHGHELAHWRQAEAEIGAGGTPKTTSRRATASKGKEEAAPKTTKPRAAAKAPTAAKPAAKPRAATGTQRKKDAAE